MSISILRSCDLEVTGWAPGRLNLLYLLVRPIEGPRRIDFSAWRCRHTLQPHRRPQIDRKRAVQRLGISRARSLGLEVMASAPGRLNLLYPPFGSLRGPAVHPLGARADRHECSAKKQRAGYARLAGEPFHGWRGLGRCGRAGGGQDGGAEQGEEAVIVPCDLSVTGLVAPSTRGRQIRRTFSCIDDAHSISEAAQKPPAPGRPAGRQAVSQPPPVICTARASVRSAGGGRSAPWRSRRRPHSRPICEEQKQSKDVLALG